MPRWFKIIAIILGIFLVALAVMLLAGRHNPGQHSGLGGSSTSIALVAGPAAHGGLWA